MGVSKQKKTYIKKMCSVKNTLVEKSSRNTVNAKHVSVMAYQERSIKCCKQNQRIKIRSNLI